MLCHLIFCQTRSSRSLSSNAFILDRNDSSLVSKCIQLSFLCDSFVLHLSVFVISFYALMQSVLRHVMRLLNPKQPYSIMHPGRQDPMNFVNYWCTKSMSQSTNQGIHANRWNWLCRPEELLLASLNSLHWETPNESDQRFVIHLQVNFRMLCVIIFHWWDQ